MLRAWGLSVWPLVTPETNFDTHALAFDVPLMCATVDFDPVYLNSVQISGNEAELKFSSMLTPDFVRGLVSLVSAKTVNFRVSYYHMRKSRKVLGSRSRVVHHS